MEATSSAPGERHDAGGNEEDDMLRPDRSTTRALLALCALAASMQPALAFNVYKVDPDCVASGAYAKIQDALDIAALSFGTDYVWISNTHAYNETVFISDQDVIIEGGFTDCNDNDIGPADRSYLSGLDKSSPVIRIAGTSHVVLSNLEIGGADSGLSDGGAIRFSGQGGLTIGASMLNNNTAKRGGGIYFSAQGGPATLTLLDGTDIFNNTASTSGGGIYIEGPARLLVQSLDTAIEFNHAETSGGGIYVGAQARADIGAPGFNGGVIHSNNAESGGGIAVAGGGVLRVFGHDVTHPSSIAANIAILYGGGIYAEGDVCLFSPDMLANDALQGAALFHNGTGGIYINAGFPGRLGTECGPESVAALGGAVLACSDFSCSSIDDSTAQAGFGLYGAIIYAQGGELNATRLQLQNNLGGSVIQTRGTTATIDTSLVTDNFVADALISIDGSLPGSSSFIGSTFAHNTIGGASVFKAINAASIAMTRDIIAEPGHATASTDGPLTVSYTMSNDISTLPHNGNPTVVANDPLFAGPFDYRLRAASPAVDFAPASGGTDLDGMPRAVDLPQEANKFGPTDLGAYELQVAFACDNHADAVFCNGFDP
jgi:hypothetical protein